ncbi:MAG: tRNA (adenosine(37)-N6)-threonylcarbamoyltransferase complex transferase subunit TsaD [Candidatus Moranbacteria bacterium]|nr:tRNA (adenosine(37)-N6)-threonylcarbamoyltransferase complex transferase subunit TsaD [Candidatus Moranbacteria bacterium]MDD3965211.1 tRNA (adenosine(37)-N6)-threonylcarbamoyltransferase complex transferase subunit TsaD [Candidatus Moranbacteria bacterium]
MHILSIETSCDDTAVALLDWNGRDATVLAHTVSSQIALHTQWGGVVPALASREHMKNIVPVIEETFSKSHLTKNDIDLIAVTEGPGLMPALLIGVSAAKTLALVWNKPLIGIHHIEGHIYANFLGKNIAIPNTKYLISNESPNSSHSKNQASLIKHQASTFPLIALVVSGGHTQLVLMQKHFDYTILGETEDDAAGEAFDKVARLLGLPYPGGPEVSRRADTFRKSHTKEEIEPLTKKFPRPMITADNFDFSFSGLKTAVLYYVKKHETEMRNESFIDETCHEFQEAVVDVLVAKTKKALTMYSPKTFVIAGGVSANVRLREQLKQTIDSINLAVEPLSEKITFLTPEFAYSLDNAVMIGVAAAFRYERMSDEQKEALIHTSLTLDPDANLPLRNL